MLGSVTCWHGGWGRGTGPPHGHQTNPFSCTPFHHCREGALATRMHCLEGAPHACREEGSAHPTRGTWHPTEGSGVCGNNPPPPPNAHCHQTVHTVAAAGYEGRPKDTRGTKWGQGARHRGFKGVWQFPLNHSPGTPEMGPPSSLSGGGTLHRNRPMPKGHLAC